MPEDVVSLFDEYAVRFARGERPELRAYMARAGAGADELAQLVDGYLQRTTAPPPSEELVVLTSAAVHGGSAFREARERRGLKIEDVVEALITALGLDRAKREKVARYYAELEAGLREPSRVDRGVLEAVGRRLSVGAPDVVSWGTFPLSLRSRDFPAAPAMAVEATFSAARAPTPEAEAPDEIDRLFGAA